MQLREPDFATLYQTGISERIKMDVHKTKIIEITKKFTLDGIHEGIGTGVHTWLRESISYLDSFAK